MSKALDRFRLTLQGISTDDDSEERKRLIDEGKEIAVRLGEYNLSEPSANYLTSTQITVDRRGLKASRRNVILSRVPVRIIREAVEDGRKRLKEADDKVEAVIQRFSTDVAEICFDTNMAGMKSTADMSKGVLITEIRKKKEKELVAICENRIRQHPLVDLRFDVGEIGLRCYTSSYSDSKLRIYFSQKDFDFLTDYDVILAKLNEVLDYTFKKQEGG